MVLLGTSGVATLNAPNLQPQAAHVTFRSSFGRAIEESGGTEETAPRRCPRIPVPYAAGLLATHAALATSTTDSPRSASRVIASERSQSNSGGERLIHALSGSWKITLSLAPNEKMPKGGTGAGEETWRAGPGGLSVIEEYQSTGSEGDVSGLGIFWPDNPPATMRVLWCDTTTPDGCALLNRPARWDGNQLVIENISELDGKRFTFRELFSEITAESFTQTIYEGESGARLKPTVTIRAVRIAKAVP